MRTVALIPARGGSKRLPRKNVLPFRGKPMIAYTIEAACLAGLFERVVVSTEDQEIAAVAAEFGAEVLRRPPELATDEARVLDVCLHFLEFEAGCGRNWDALCCLYATSPLRTSEDIRSTVGLLEPGVCDFALAVSTYSLPPHQALAVEAGGLLRPMWPDLVHKRGSDLPPLVCDNGSIYAVTVEAFRRHKTFFGPGLRGHPMPRRRSVDIDTAEDLDMAALYAREALP